MKKTRGLLLLVASLSLLGGCSNTTHHASADFVPPSRDYKMVVMRPQADVGVLTAGGGLEHREDWSEQATANLIVALQNAQHQRGGRATVAATDREAGGRPGQVAQLNRLHEAVGRSIRLHKYNPGLELPTKKNVFDWTLGESAVDYGRASGYDYALFLFASDSFSSGGRVALQAVSMLGCVVGVCYIPPGGQQIAFVSLVDLSTGRVVWYNFLLKGTGDIRTHEGAQDMVDELLADMKSPANRS